MSVHPEVDDKHDNELAVDYELDPVDNIPLGNSLPHSPTKNNAKYFSLWPVNRHKKNNNFVYNRWIDLLNKYIIQLHKNAVIKCYKQSGFLCYFVVDLLGPEFNGENLLHSSMKYHLID